MYRIVTGKTRKIESHIEKLKESEDVIRQCIEEGIIGFHASVAAI